MDDVTVTTINGKEYFHSNITEQVNKEQGINFIKSEGSFSYTFFYPWASILRIVITKPMGRSCSSKAIV